MPIIKITAADIKRAEVVEAKWWGAQITKIDPPEKSAAGDSVNIWYYFTIEGTGGKEIRHNFNSKGWMMMPALEESVSGKKVTAEEGSAFELDTDLHLMKKLDVHLYVDNYAGRLSNKIDNFLPYGKGTSQAVPY
jgi:hypothetical protein